jgi:hypothetical protein
VIRPAALVAGETLGFDPAIMRQNLELGFGRAAEALGTGGALYAAASSARSSPAGSSSVPA